VVDDKDPVELGKVADEQDMLYIVRTRVRWGEGMEKDQSCEELVRYVWERKK
jgi:hypothetical protein